MPVEISKPSWRVTPGVVEVPVWKVSLLLGGVAAAGGRIQLRDRDLDGAVVMQHIAQLCLGEAVVGVAVRGDGIVERGGADTGVDVEAELALPSQGQLKGVGCADAGHVERAGGLSAGQRR